ncbi:hypothetical protein LCM20_03260 [Halobacillus litoralis]|nr:hypothetical protein [Halobacillus litoralis]MCA0969610.1 hypothetical protein [Halobacillus litoralis]
MGKETKDRKVKSRTEVQPFDESKMEPKRLTDAARKEMEADQHTVGGF